MNMTTTNHADYDSSVELGFTKSDVDQLNSLIRGELSAVETYEQAIDTLESRPAFESTLRECQQSHSARAARMAGYVTRLGGEPAESSGVWGSVAKMIEGGATLFGEKAALSVLEEGEDHGLAEYKREMNRMSPPVRSYVANTILPEQQRTHDRLSAIEDRI